MTTMNLKLTRPDRKTWGQKRSGCGHGSGNRQNLVMLSQPSYDPNNLTDARWKKLTQSSSDDSVLYNRATQGLYPPGSTFKLYTALEFMRENSDYEKYSYRCQGSIGSGDTKIKCYEGEVHGRVDLSMAFAESCNAAFCNIGSGLNVSKMEKIMRIFIL